MLVTITSLKLRSLWGFFKLSWFALKISIQAKGEKGFVALKNTGFGYLHYTVSGWQTEEDVKRFSKTGSHLMAMKQASALASEIKTHTYQSHKIPTWQEAKILLRENGKLLTFK
jgi:hypothetical protein